jgi:hypothetical protein
MAATLAIVPIQDTLRSPNTIDIVNQINHFTWQCRLEWPTVQGNKKEAKENNLHLPQQCHRVLFLRQEQKKKTWGLGWRLPRG